MPLNICLTVDVESYTKDYEDHVHGGGAGLPYLLRTLKEHDLRAAFFVEMLAATRWGMDSVRKFCDEIGAGGHEIGLQIHPADKNLLFVANT